LADKGKTMDSTVPALIKDALDAVPFASLEECAKRLAVTLSDVPQPGSNNFFSVYQSTASRNPLLGAVELRANFKETPRRQLLIVTFSKAVPLQKSELDAFLNSTGVEMGPSTPHLPGSRAYVTYSFKSAKLRVEYEALGSAAVIGFVVDTTAAESSGAK
jgi:hypothetical protein